MKDVLVLVATGFEDTELITTLNVLKRNGISYDLASIENKNQVQGQNEALVITKPLQTLASNQYRSLFLPGGKGHLLLLASAVVLELVRNYQAKYLFAICAAPAIFVQANVINGSFTSYPGFAQHHFNTGQALEILPQMITARDYQVTIPFAAAIVAKLKQS